MAVSCSLLQLLPGLAGVAIALSVYRLSVAQRQDAWLRTLWDFQRAFWQDERMEQVRSWIACDEAYKEVQEVLKKRMEKGADTELTATNISPQEYKLLETIDRFAAVLVGYSKIAPPDSIIKGTVKFRLFDEYWLGNVTKHRPELHAYLKRFFPELLKSID